jgi:hypothetical protein
MAAAFAGLRDSARRRSIEFNLTKLQFSCLAGISQYLTQKGPYKGNLTVDRRDNLRGYTEDNVQFLTRSANSVKQAKHDQRRYEAGYAWASAAHYID